MAEFPIMPFHVDAYLSATENLATIEHGAYQLILMQMWRHGGVLPNDDKVLAGYAKLRLYRWKKMKPTIMAFMRIEGNFITQNRLIKLIELGRQHSFVQSQKAKRMWAKKRQSFNAPAYATAMPVHMPGDAKVSKIVSTNSFLENSTRSENGQADEKTQTAPPNLAAPPPNRDDETPNQFAPTSALMNSRLVKGLRQQ